MKKAFSYIFFLVIGLLVFTGCMKQVGKNIQLQSERELLNEKRSKKYKLQIDKDRMKVVDGTTDLSNLEYDREITLKILEDNVNELISLKVNGEEQISKLDDGKIKIRIKEDTQVVASYKKKKHIIKIAKDSTRYVKFISSASLKLGDECKFKLQNLDELYNYDVKVENSEIEKDGDFYKFKVTGDNTIKVLKTENFQKLNIFYSMQNSNSGQYNLVDALLKGLFFRSSDIRFIENKIRLTEAKTKYNQDEFGKLVSWSLDILKVANREYKFTFDYDKLFTKSELGERVVLKEKDNRLVFRLYKENPSVNQTEYEDYKVTFTLDYKTEDGISKSVNLDMKDGILSMDLQNKKDVSLRINVELL